MKLIYLANIGIPSDWGHSVQIMKMCEAFAENGAEVKLVVARGRNSNDNGNPFAFYNVKPIFKIVRVPSLNLFPGNPGAIWYWIRLFSFLISARVYLLTQNYDVCYTRELYAGPFFKNVFMERHLFPKVVTDFHKFVFNRVAGLVVLTSFLRSKLVDNGIGSRRILVAHDAVRLEDFDSEFSTDFARSKLSIPNNIHVFGYVGTLKTMGMEKGLTTAISALLSLPQSYQLYVVGGENEDVEYYKKYAGDMHLAERVMFAGKVPHKDIPLHIGACDVLVAPFPENEHYSYYMSPLKIFEYMASKRPMVVTDLPSLREVLIDAKTAMFAPTGDSKALAEKVRELVENKTLARELANSAYREVVEKYTWKKRAKDILEFIVQSKTESI